MNYSDYFTSKYDEVISLALSTNTDIYTVCENVTDGCRNTCNKLYQYVTENIQQEINDRIYDDNPAFIKQLKNLIKPPAHVNDPITYNLF